MTRMRFWAGATTCFVTLAALLGAAEKDTSVAAVSTARSSAADGVVTPGEILELKRMLADQQRQITELRRALEQQKRAAPVQAAAPMYPKAAEAIASATPMIPPVPVAAAAAPVALPPAPQANDDKPSPLSFGLGSAWFTPVGFMDFTAVFRDTDPGSNIGTNFGNFPYRAPGAANANLSELRLSPQNSRLGVRVDAMVKGAKVLGYWESDFLGSTGNPPNGNVSVSSNSYPFRLRLYWVDVKKDKWEILAGQTWSLMTPGRKGISGLPGDLFYSQVIDVNYMAGLTWGRIPEFRFVYHPADKVAFGLALSNAEQYIGGSGGAGTTVLPTNLAATYGTQLNNASNVLAIPNAAPDVIAKLTFDPSSKAHVEVAGVARTFKVYNPTTVQHFTKMGGGGSLNANLELAKGFRVFTNNYLSDGGGRYIFGQAPDVVVKGDGSLGLVHANSTLDGVEYTRKNTMLYGYYGLIWIGRNMVIDPANGKPVGYGYAGSANSQNKDVQEFSLGFNQTLWKDAKVGALNLMGQYAYYRRNPWFVAAGTPASAHLNEVFINLRYTLPGAAPTLK